MVIRIKCLNAKFEFGINNVLLLCFFGLKLEYDFSRFDKTYFCSIIRFAICIDLSSSPLQGMESRIFLSEIGQGFQ